MGRVKTGNGPNDRLTSRTDAGASSVKELDLENLDEALEIEEKYTNEQDEISRNVKQLHPNRNLNKPNIDKPPYS